MTLLRTAALVAITLAATACHEKGAGAPAQGATGAAVQSPTVVGVNAPLSVQVFNPGEEAIFAVSSVLVQGRRDAVLIDAQFSTEQAERLVAMIKASGRRLQTIYISHGDPDYYFGLETLTTAFPDAHVLATAQTVAHIQATREAKLAFWGPQMGAGAPVKTIVPAQLQGDTIMLEGQPLKIVGLDGLSPDRTFVWIPAIRTVAGGIPVQAGEHVWMADTQTPESHAAWLSTLDSIRALQPMTVIPGHYAGALPERMGAVDFTAAYIRTFDEEAAKAADAAALIKAMRARYPHLGGGASLEISAKVAKGEMAWK